jgi:hypothetical protein
MRFISKRILEKFISVSNKDTWACDIIISSFQGRGVAICYYVAKSPNPLKTLRY